MTPDRTRAEAVAGRLVRQYRLAQRLTQDALAAKSGVSKARISQIESGAGMTVYVLMCLSHGLQVEMRALTAFDHWQRERMKAEDDAALDRDRIQRERLSEGASVPGRVPVSDPGRERARRPAELAAEARKGRVGGEVVGGMPTRPRVRGWGGRSAR